MARCRSCGAPIVWAKDHETGKPNPIDAEPTELGNIVLLPGEKYRVLTAAERVNHPSIVKEPRHVSHFFTCPTREQHGGRLR